MRKRLVGVVVLALALSSRGATCEDGYRLTCTPDKGCYEPPPGSRSADGVPHASVERPSRG